MTSTLKKTLGVSLLLSVGSIAAMTVDFLTAKNPDPINAIQVGLAATLLTGLSIGIGWCIGKAVYWCFN